VRTEFTLRPGSSALEIKTVISNNNDRILRQVQPVDVLYPGRTVRFDPRIGMFPRGRTDSVEWFSFFRDEFSWAFALRPGNQASALHEPDRTILRYARRDMPPGGDCVVQRRLLAATGGPAAAWRGVRLLYQDSNFGVLNVRSGREGGSSDLPPVQLIVTSNDNGSRFGALAQQGGATELRLPAGNYSVMVIPPGGTALGPIRLSVFAGKEHTLTLPPLACGAVNLTAELEGPGGAAQSPEIHVRALPMQARGEPWLCGSAFPMQYWARERIATSGERMLYFLPPSGPSLPKSFALVCSKGPLYSSAAVLMSAGAQPQAPLRASLRRLIDPGGYVAVDFNQRGSASPRCALSAAERLALNAAEGLQGAVLLDPTFAPPAEAPPGSAGGALINGYLHKAPGVGSFGLFPIPKEGGRSGEFVLATRRNPSAQDVLHTMRQLFPDALVQINRPMDKNYGFFALNDELPEAEFDLIELLHGTDVKAARTALPRWFELLKQGRRVAAVAGSGSATYAPPAPGVARTYVHCPARGDAPTAAEIERAIAGLPDQPNAFVTNGPFIRATLNGKPIGSTQTVKEGKARLEVKVLAVPRVDVSSIRIYRNGKLLRDYPVLPGGGAIRAERVFDLPLEGDCWFVVEVTGDRPVPFAGADGEAPRPWAVTNPFWVDTDGDGLVWIKAGRT
ncbi:MAG: CehA/McbA family metallohydrolase, partial [Planctomycetes bacterium]|nr:CehA/McbA family metallohydrolase [Planctomycetota bacterium]